MIAAGLPAPVGEPRALFSPGGVCESWGPSLGWMSVGPATLISALFTTRGCDDEAIDARLAGVHCYLWCAPVCDGWFVTVYPCDQPTPGGVVPNLVASLSKPERIVESRYGTGGAQAKLTWVPGPAQVTGVAGVPAGASAALANFTLMVDVAIYTAGDQWIVPLPPRRIYDTCESEKIECSLANSCSTDDQRWWVDLSNGTLGAPIPGLDGLNVQSTMIDADHRHRKRFRERHPSRGDIRVGRHDA